MAKKPKLKPVAKDSGTTFAEKLLVALQPIDEQQRPKNYDDLLAYARKYDDLEKVKENFPLFPSNLKISAYDTAAPYYGGELQGQYSAAQEYAKQLSESKLPSVKIDPSYYQEFTRQVPVVTSPVMPHYNKTKDFLSFPDPIDYASVLLNLSPQQLSQNNYRDNNSIKEYLKLSMSNAYRDTIEHEAGHIADKQVKFPYTQDAGKQFGYMAQDNHLVTGLSKIQRELYSISGKRIESPDEFKNYILNLAASEKPEEQISVFSEEAKRALRPQIENAKLLNKFNSEMNEFNFQKKKWDENKSWFKGSAPISPEKKGDAYFLEKSAQLIPALVNVNTNYDRRTT